MAVFAHGSSAREREREGVRPADSHQVMFHIVCLLDLIRLNMEIRQRRSDSESPGHWTDLVVCDVRTGCATVSSDSVKYISQIKV